MQDDHQGALAVIVGPFGGIAKDSLVTTQLMLAAEIADYLRCSTALIRQAIRNLEVAHVLVSHGGIAAPL
jgi:hypothetical protein